MKEDIDEIVRQIHSKPADMLALGRTIMACQRSLLSFISTSVGFLVAGIGIIMYLSNPVLIIIGLVLIIASLVILFFGCKNYRDMQKLLSQAYQVLKSPQAARAKNAFDE